MRRKEREIQDREAIDAIIRECRVCRLGLTDGKEPYVVPLSFGYDGESFYFHGASVGKKMDLLRQNSRVCVELDVLDELRPSEEACRWSAGYRSVIAFGTAEIITALESKRKALAIIMAHYSDGSYTFTDKALEGTAVIRVAVEKITGKQS
ncbi:MAG: pyridoxamine 5'-phosphate oxidase family protein [Syntrophobacteraceae bacterium]